MKTLEDFKGTKNLPEFKPMGVGGAFTLTYRHKSEEEANANSKLFANSYKLLEAADKIQKDYERVMRAYLETAFKKDVADKIVSEHEGLNYFKQAIQDCL